MDLGALEGQTSRGLFSNCIFDPSMIGALHKLQLGHSARPGNLIPGETHEVFVDCQSRVYMRLHIVYQGNLQIIIGGNIP